MEIALQSSGAPGWSDEGPSRRRSAYLCCVAEPFPASHMVHRANAFTLFGPHGPIGHLRSRGIDRGLSLQSRRDAGA